MITIIEIATILAKPFWKLQDIAVYTSCCKSKASAIKKSAEYNYKGAVHFNGDLVRREAVFKVLGVDYEEELRNIKDIVNAIKEGLINDIDIK